MTQLITGIQQVGIGVSDVQEAWSWYRKMFSINVPVFDDKAEATLMKQYTGDKVHSRRAVLALNMMGGGGFEVWQFTSRTPSNSEFTPEIGDLGINAVKIKTPDAKKIYHEYKLQNTEGLSEFYSHPIYGNTFWLRDPYNNLFQIVEGPSWFKTGSDSTGGVCGVTMGVSDIDAALPLYSDVLGFDTVLFDETGTFDDLDPEQKYRRICLRKPQTDEGAFSRLLGHIDIELIEVKTRKPKKIFKNRYWGDLGFIHVCFDVTDMQKLKEKCEEIQYPFTIDSADTFDMGEAAGRFSYIEDPDGTLIEFVQTHKIPIMKKWGWYINLKTRKTQKPLPNWMLRSMSLNRVK